MAKLANEIELNPWRPSVEEHVEHTSHTQIGIPLRRAQAVATIRFLRIMGWVAAAGFAGGMAWAFGTGYEAAGFILLGLLFIMGAAAVASREPMDAFIAAQLLDITDPFRDSEFRALQALRQQQPAPEPPPVLRVEAHVGGGRWRYADLAAPNRSALVWFARDVAAGLPFAGRVATRHGYSRAQFDSLRDRFLEAAWCVWKNEDAPAQGLLLTEPGMQVVRDIAASSLAEARRGC